MCFVQVFSASVSGYRYICSKFITAPMIHNRESDMIGSHVYLIAIYLLHYTCSFITWFTLKV